MATTPTRLMTFAEFERLPEPTEGRYELYHGELVTVAPPKHKHSLAQRRLRRLLERASGGTGVVEIEIGFRARPEHEYCVGDVVYVSQDRWGRIDPEGNLRGAPELVIEVLSRSNTKAKLMEKEEMCLANGSEQFWGVDLDRRQVKVSTSDGRVITYSAGQRIPLFFAPNASIAVDEIFAD